MTKIIPVLKPFGWLLTVCKMTQKILIFEKARVVICSARGRENVGHSRSTLPWIGEI